MSKTALVLGSGGARGFAHIGVIQALLEADIKIDLVLGTSIGAIVGGAFALGLSLEEIKEIAFGIKQRHIVDYALLLKKHKGIIKGKKIDKLLDSVFKDKTFKDCKIPFACVSNEIISGTSVTFCEGELKRGIRASISIPSLIAPLKEDGKIYVDGGITNRLALRQARELGADKIIAVDVLGEIDTTAKVKGPISLMFRTLECIDIQVVKESLQKYNPEVVICPNLHSVDATKFKDLERVYKLGYDYTKERIKEIKTTLLKDEK